MLFLAHIDGERKSEGERLSLSLALFFVELSESKGVVTHYAILDLEQIWASSIVGCVHVTLRGVRLKPECFSIITEILV